MVEVLIKAALEAKAIVALIVVARREGSVLMCACVYACVCRVALYVHVKEKRARYNPTVRAWLVELYLVGLE